LPLYLPVRIPISFFELREDSLRKSFIFAACLLMAPLSWADQPTPPVIPIPSGDEALPPPLDQTQATPVVVPMLPGDKTTTEAAPATTQPALPPPPIAEPTSVPTKAVAAVPSPKMAEPTFTPTAKASASEPASSGAPVSLGALTDYFPIQEGAQWTYEYLKPSAGQTAKGTYTVKCTAAKTMSNGTVRVVLQTNENGQVTQDHYSLYDNKIEHMGEDSQTTTGDFVFKVPPATGGVGWAVTEKDGTVHKSKAAFGQAQVYQKTYPDCVVVTEKVLKGGKASNTVIYYYAKGIGLVAIEVYSPKMKLIQDKSVALTKGPGASTP